jgi:hypothetical protein
MTTPDACGIGGIAPLVLIVALEGGDSFSRLCLVTRGTSPDTHGIGRWVGPSVGPNALQMRNCLPVTAAADLRSFHILARCLATIPTEPFKCRPPILRNVNVEFVEQVSVY